MKYLYRSRSNRKFAGVLGGLAEYFNADATIFRIIFIILSIVTAFMPMALGYVLAMFVIPNEEEVIQ